MSKVHIKVNKEKCVGSTTCIYVAEGQFKLDQDGQAELNHSNNQSIELLKEAAEACPVGAIEIEDI